METNLLSNPMVKLLSKFQHHPRTDVAQKRINNTDFIVLCMYALGHFGLRELQTLANNWRRDTRVLDAYFTPHYGHTATDGTSNKRFRGYFSSAPKRTLMWYRQVPHLTASQTPAGRMQRYKNALTMAGIHRAEDLILRLSGHTKA